MTEVIAAMLFGFALIGLEAIVPGGVLGVLGFFSIIFSAYLSHKAFGGWFAPSVTFLVGSLGAILLVFIEFKWLAKSRLGKSLFLASADDGVSNSEISPDDVLGKQGESLTDHHPEGLVSLDGKSYDAVCEDGYLPKGCKVKVTGLDDFRIRVRRL
jgi:membrane-bound serine protease (ClpP class)